MPSRKLAAAGTKGKAVGAVAFVSVVVLTGAPTPQAQAAAEWHSDGRSWSGIGSVVVPGAGHVGSHTAGHSGCDGCRWSVIPACAGPVGMICGAMTVAFCGPSAGWFYTLFAASARDDPTVVATSCIGPDQRPVSSAEIDREVHQQIQAHAPPLRPRYQPTGHAITQLPTVFATGQPRAFEESDTILGFELHLVAHAHWHWNWGDGSNVDTRQPGGSWPDMSLAHTYRQAGSVRATVAADWDASYSVSGGESLVVDGPPVSQAAGISIRVRQARAVLTE